MSTNVIAVIFVFLVIAFGFFLFSGNASAPATSGMPAGDHMMDNGTVMENTEPMMLTETQTDTTHTMPDGSTMVNTGAHIMPDGTMMTQ